MENDEMQNRTPAAAQAAPAAREEVLDVAPRIYREYENEFRKLAREATSDSQRELYLKAAQTWHEAAQRFEFETRHFKSGYERQKPAA